MRINNSWVRSHNTHAIAKKARARGRHFAAQERRFIDPSEANPAYIGRVGGVGEGKVIILYRGEYFSVPLEKSQQPVVGDLVLLETEEDDLTIREILARQSFIARLRGDASRRSHAGFEQQIIAANIDIAVIVASTLNPEFHPRFVDRYLVVAQNGGVKPIIVLCKSDLTEKRDPILSYYSQLGVPVIETSARTGNGIAKLKEQLRKRIAVLVGHSGVGKSSLINSLIPGTNLRTNEVSAKTGKGRHTTTSSHLYQWEKDSYIIDTPGIRSLGVENLDELALDTYFPEFEPYLGNCKYNNCLHLHEPGCAIKAALQSGNLNAPRYESYIRLLGEIRPALPGR
ncbi:ribosome small subunit-dependent GTPase A [Patescibacteria group bacterium]|nr:ribosome small subunit-dependent GTPase A [Patescibacteria group bacterium]